MKKTNLILMAAAAVVLQSCATMFGGANYNAHIEIENRPDAEIYVNRQKVSKTGQSTTKEKRNKDLYVKVKDGDCTVNKNFENELRLGWIIYDGFQVLYGNILPIATDFISGAIYKPEESFEVQRQGVNDFMYIINIDDQCPTKE